MSMQLNAYYLKGQLILNFKFNESNSLNYSWDMKTFFETKILWKVMKTRYDFNEGYFQLPELRCCSCYYYLSVNLMWNI